MMAASPYASMNAAHIAQPGDVSVVDEFATGYLAKDAETPTWHECGLADNCKICDLYVGLFAPLKPKTQCRSCAVVICRNHTGRDMFNVGESMNPESHHVTDDDQEHWHNVCTDCYDKKKGFMCSDLTTEIGELTTTNGKLGTKNRELTTEKVEMTKIATEQKAVIAARELTITAHELTITELMAEIAELKIKNTHMMNVNAQLSTMNQLGQAPPEEGTPPEHSADSHPLTVTQPVQNQDGEI